MTKRTIKGHGWADEGVCLGCWNSQQQRRPPFWIYCPHRGRLIRVLIGRFERYDVGLKEIRALVNQMRERSV